MIQVGCATAQEVFHWPIIVEDQVAP